MNGMLLRYSILAVGLGALAWGAVPRTSAAPNWNRPAADAYLDARMSSWMHGGAMENGTFCISCHTGLPFALARGSGAVQAQVIASVEKRVSLWPAVQPYLGDHAKAPGTESVINALTLAFRDAPLGRLSPSTRKAFDEFWATQITGGPDAGSWPWVNFGNEPWEAPDSGYWGATLAAVAVGTAPEGYRQEPQIQHGVSLLVSYLRLNCAKQTLFGRLGVLWADEKLPGILSADQRRAIVSEVLAHQNSDGGWSTASLLDPNWKRHDGTPQSLTSDGYATGLAIVALGRGTRAVSRALRWLRSNQDPSGAWPAVSPNAVRDPHSDVAHFMTDASTAFAVLALTAS